MQNQSEERNSESMAIPGEADIYSPDVILSDETWEHVFDASPGYIAFVTPDFRIKRMNKALANKLGGESHQFIGNLCYELLHNSSEPIEDCAKLSVGEVKKVRSFTIDNPLLGKANVKAIPVHTCVGNIFGCLYIANPSPDSSISETSSFETERVTYSLVNALPDPAIICDLTGSILYVSESFSELIGITDKSLIIGSNYITFLAPDEIERSLLDFSSVSKGPRKKVTGQYLMRKASRNVLKAEVTMNPVAYAGETPNSILITFRDISGQSEVDEFEDKNKIRVSRLTKTFLGFSPEPRVNINRLVTLIGEMLGASCCTYSKFEENTTTPFASWKSPFMSDFDPDKASQVVFEQYKKNPEDFIVLHKLQLADLILTDPALFENYGIKTLIGIVVRSGGRIIGLISAIFTFNFQLRNNDREFCAMVASALALEESRNPAPRTTEVNDLNYRELFDFFTDSIYILNPKGIFIDVNTGAVKMYGYSREEMIGKTPEMLSAEGKNDLIITNEYINKAFNGESQKFEWWGKRKSGEIFPKEVVLNKGRYFGQDVVIAIGRDIAERKQVEEHLLGYNLELREQNQSKDKFFSILAHDLKNPFGGLLGFIDLLYEDIDELSTEQVKEYLQNIRSASYHTYSLLENLLEWSRLQTGKVSFKPSKFDLFEEVESVLSVLQSNSIHKNIQLLNTLQPGIIAEADRNMIHSVVQNLITNAIKFSNSNTTVTISGRIVVPDVDNNSGNEEELQRKWFEVDISDTGIGIPEEIMPRLFKLDGQFSMAGTANEPGTGLGLILCKEMVEKNGGKIRVESQAGKGSTFSFSLPLGV